MGWEPVKCHNQGRASPKVEVKQGKPSDMLSHTVGMNQNWLSSKIAANGYAFVLY